ncbi:MAG: PIN domain nuclease [Acidobacteria bacterium]|nr:MAG: PIN domain nuclease [Acidobacteriota bacterium]
MPPLLLDTQAFLWWVSDDARLTARARRAIARDACVVSVASCWEMSIKASLGKLTVDGSMEKFIGGQLAANGFTLLPIALEHTTAVARLPFHHRDPFDRLLAAQAIAEELRVVSSDAVFERYGVKRVW